MTQILAYADGVVIIGRSLARKMVLPSQFIKLDAKARRVGLRVNERKTKWH